MSERKQWPSVGRDVHYVARGSADGRFPPVCRAAKVTEVNMADSRLVGLCVINPTGLFFHPLDGNPGGCWQDEEGHEGGTWHWPERV